ncbi:hypothetical protein ACJX0J_029730, partial [Zea mays]
VGMHQSIIQLAERCIIHIGLNVQFFTLSSYISGTHEYNIKIKYEKLKRTIFKLLLKDFVLAVMLGTYLHLVVCIKNRLKVLIFWGTPQDSKLYYKTHFTGFDLEYIHLSKSYRCCACDLASNSVDAQIMDEEA